MEIKWDGGKQLIAIFMQLSINEVAFIIIGCENAFMASVSQFITMLVSAR